jgi:hypothetical protein
MRKTAALFLVLAASAAFGQQQHPPGNLVGDLGTCDATREGFLRKVTDGNSTTDCATGTGDETVVCACIETSPATFSWQAVFNTNVGALADDDLSNDSITALSGVTVTAELFVDANGAEFEAGDALTDCSTFVATNGGIFYDDSEGKFKKCEDNVLTDLDTGGGGGNSISQGDTDATVTDTGTDGQFQVTVDGAITQTTTSDGTTPDTTFRSPGTGSNTLQVFKVDIEDLQTPRFIVREDGDVLFPGTSATDAANLNNVLIGLSSNASGDGTLTGEGQVCIGRSQGCQGKDGSILIGSHNAADGSTDAEEHVIGIGTEIDIAQNESIGIGRVLDINSHSSVVIGAQNTTTTAGDNNQVVIAAGV